MASGIHRRDRVRSAADWGACGKLGSKDGRRTNSCLYGVGLGCLPQAESLLDSCWDTECSGIRGDVLLQLGACRRRWRTAVDGQ